MKNGKINYGQMKKLRIGIEDVIELTRNAGITELGSVKHLIIETNGKPSIITDKKSLPDILISDGKFMRDIYGRRGDATLEKLNAELRKANINTVSSIVLAYEYDHKINIFTRKEVI
jgi:uncharacterized membrane protein YcaP (DUF421 family)